MGLFPGRTLEELDMIDLNRLLRAQAAQRMEAVEARRRLLMAGKLDGSDISEREGQLMIEMDDIEATPNG